MKSGSTARIPCLVGQMAEAQTPELRQALQEESYVRKALGVA